MDLGVIILIVAIEHRPGAEACEVENPDQECCEVPEAVGEEYLVGVVYIHVSEVLCPVLGLTIGVGQAEPG